MDYMELARTGKPEDIQRYINSATAEQRSAVVKAASERESAFVPRGWEGKIVRLPDSEYPEIGVYLLDEEASREVVPGSHSTNEYIADEIARVGFKGSPVYLSPLNGAHGNLGIKTDNMHYASLATGKMFGRMMSLLLENPRDPELAKDPDLLLKKIDELYQEAARRGPSYYWSCRWLPQDLADKKGTRGALVEAIIPISRLQDHTNGRVVDGKFSGYELQTERVGPEDIVRVSEPFEIHEHKIIVAVEDIVPMDMAEVLEMFPEPIDSGDAYMECVRVLRERVAEKLKDENPVYLDDIFALNDNVE